MDNAWSIGAVALSLLLVGGYELLQWRAANKDPRTTARSAHSLLRGEWVHALSQHTGTELLAVQALRNSLMSATITASTAVLVLTGFISLIAARGDDVRAPMPALSLGRVLDVGLGLALFAAYVCSAMAMRYYHHTGFLMSLPVGTPERHARESLACTYLQRAGILYSWSLRCFLFAAAVALVFVLSLFDQAPRLEA